MEVTIERSEKANPQSKQDLRSVTIGEKSITTIVTDEELQQDMTEWIAAVQHSNNNSKKTIIVGFSADRSLHYRNGTQSHSPFFKGEHGFQLLQLCVGRHCLLCTIEDDHYCSSGFPYFLQKFLSHRNTIVVGCGIKKIAEKLEEQNGFKVPRIVELRELTAEKGYNQGKDLSKFNLNRLARLVLGGEGVKKPAKIDWHDTEVSWKQLSDDMVKYATVEAFLAYEIGVKLLENSQ